jgi:ATP phosphoribosyltransferase regulatory subunit
LSLSELFEIDLGDVSRLDYYTGLTFKIYVEGAGACVGSGGRYDNLTANFGKAEPAVGFVLDLEALTSLLTSVDKGPGLDNQEGRRAQTIVASDPAELFRKAIQKRAMNECVVINSGDSGEVTR